MCVKGDDRNRKGWSWKTTPNSTSSTDTAKKKKGLPRQSWFLFPYVWPTLWPPHVYLQKEDLQTDRPCPLKSGRFPSQTNTDSLNFWSSSHNNLIYIFFLIKEGKRNISRLRSRIFKLTYKRHTTVKNILFLLHVQQGNWLTNNKTQLHTGSTSLDLHANIRVLYRLIQGTDFEVSKCCSTTHRRNPGRILQLWPTPVKNSLYFRKRNIYQHSILLGHKTLHGLEILFIQNKHLIFHWNILYIMFNVKSLQVDTGCLITTALLFIW